MPLISTHPKLQDLEETCKTLFTSEYQDYFWCHWQFAIFIITMFTLESLIVLAVAAILVYTWRHWPCESASGQGIPESSIADLQQLRVNHDLRDEFLKLVQEDGAGSWPPVARHDGWPAPLHAYRQVYAEVAPFLANEHPSLDDSYNLMRCSQFRGRMRSSLAQHVDAHAAGKCLQFVLDGDWTKLSRDSFNGFYSCVACLRHAYRYVIIVLEDSNVTNMAACNAKMGDEPRSSCLPE